MLKNKSTLTPFALWPKYHIRNFVTPSAAAFMFLALNVFWSISSYSGQDNYPKLDTPSICAYANAPEYCRWSKAKRLAFNKQIFDKAARDITGILLRHLEKAEWVPAEQEWSWERTTDGSDPGDPANKAACADRLTALRKGQFKLFPAPQVRSSEVGYQMIVQRLERRRALQDCPPKQKSDQFTGWDNSPGRHSLPPAYLYWYYERPQAQAWIAVSPSGNMNKNENLHMPFDIYLENDRCGLERKIPSNSGYTSQLNVNTIESGRFKEFTYGLVEIGGALYALEGGVLGMEDAIWKYDKMRFLLNEYRDFSRPPERVEPEPESMEIMGKATSQKPIAVAEYKIGPFFKFTKAQQKSYDKTGLWPARVLLLYPLLPLNESDFCMWNLGD